MSRRKRQPSASGVNQNGRRDTENKTPQMELATNSKTRITVASLVVMLMAVTFGVYMYNFPDAVDTLQAQLATFISPQLPGQQQQSKSLPTQHEHITQPQSHSLPEEKPRVYSKEGITNSADNKIRDLLDEADSKLEKANLEEALSAFDALLAQHPDSPRARYGRAQTLDRMSEQRKSNLMLEQCIDDYTKVLHLKEVPKDLAILAGTRCADRQTFRGWATKAVKTTQSLIARFPEDIVLYNNLGISYLMAGRPNSARKEFMTVLDRDPNNGVALVHYGFILKTTDINYNESIKYLKRGIESEHKGTVDGRFIFHLGDAYYRTGQPNMAYQTYKFGAESGVFLSMWQRSLYNVDRLTGRPLWSLEQTTIASKLKNLKKHWTTIRDEGLAQLNEEGKFVYEDENLREAGLWKQFTLYSKGRKNKNMCALTPKTCSLIDKIPEVAHCTRGQVKFSVMDAGTHVWPHCGPTNCRIRIHLGLVIPDGPELRIADQVRTWKEGEFLIFDDSFEHEVWHHGDKSRLVLIIDMWHPELTLHERNTLAPI